MNSGRRSKSRSLPFCADFVEEVGDVIRQADCDNRLAASQPPYARRGTGRGGTKHLGAIRALATARVIFASALSPGLIGLLLDAGIPLERQLLVMGLYCFAASAWMALLMPQLRRLAAFLETPALRENASGLIRRAALPRDPRIGTMQAAWARLPSGIRSPAPARARQTRARLLQRQG